MAILVYIICAITSSGCAALLLRGYLKGRANLLLWSFFCFVCLALNNIILIADAILGPEYDLSLIRASLSAMGTFILLFGLVWDTV